MNRVVKRSVSIRGHRTSVSLEEPFAEELRAIADRRGMPLAALIAEIDAGRPRDTNLSSALRLYVLDWLRSRILAGDAATDALDEAGPRT